MAALRRRASADSQGASSDSGGFATGTGELEGEGGIKERKHERDAQEN